MTAKDELPSQLQDALKTIQERRKFLSIAVYEINGEYAERVAAEGAANVVEFTCRSATLGP